MLAGLLSLPLPAQNPSFLKSYVCKWGRKKKKKEEEEELFKWRKRNESWLAASVREGEHRIPPPLSNKRRVNGKGTAVRLVGEREGERH